MHGVLRVPGALDKLRSLCLSTRTQHDKNQHKQPPIKNVSPPAHHLAFWKASTAFHVDKRPSPHQHLGQEKMMEGAALEEGPAAAPWTRWRSSASQKLQQVLDRWTPFPLYRWLGVLVLALVYAVRVYYLEGFYIITYALGIYVLGLLIAFLSPQVDPEFEGPVLPTKSSDEFRPFLRRLPEFKFWYSLSKAVCLAFVLTFFPILDVPVFWPILVVYWVVIAFLTLRRQIRHMIKHKYVPFSVGKQRYSGKPAASTEKGLGEESSGETDAAESLDEHSDRLLPA